MRFQRGCYTHNITNYSNVGMTIFNNIHMLTVKKFKRLGRSHIIAVNCETNQVAAVSQYHILHLYMKLLIMVPFDSCLLHIHFLYYDSLNVKRYTFI